jgi:hypothetical protein
VRGVWVVEPRGELRFAKEALMRSVVARPPRMQHLDDRRAFERRLFAAIHGAVATCADPFVENKLAYPTP